MRRWLLMGVPILVGLAAIAYAGTVADTGPPEVVVVTGVERVFPEPGSGALRQTSVGADLEAGYVVDDLRITTGGRTVRIPEDQLQINRALETVVFTPGPGTEITELAPGEVCASVTVRRFDEPVGQARTQSWCFQVQA